MDTTDAATLPNDIKLKLLKIRDALVLEDIDEAYHTLYSIADPTFESYEPWQSLHQADAADRNDAWPREELTPKEYIRRGLTPR